MLNRRRTAADYVIAFGNADTVSSGLKYSMKIRPTVPQLYLLVLALIFAPVSSLAQPSAGPILRGQSRGDTIPGRFIVVLKAGAKTSAVAARHGLAPDVEYTAALNGFAGAFSAAQASRLLDDTQVDFVEADQVVTIGAQTLQPGVNRIDAELNATFNATTATTGVNVDIAIIDTGIDLKHPELNVVKNVSYVTGAKSGNDDNGHGSHCAGIAAARNNTVGVVGVAPGARLWAVKVLDRNGSGAMSNVIKGVDFVTANAAAIEVANMSLGGGNSDALNIAIASSVAKGVVYAVAAGNEAKDAAASSPANSPLVLCVSAVVDTDGRPGQLGSSTSFGADDTFATFSNFGLVVDIAAPGVNIYSTYKGGAYTTMSGTSMASPHVAGAVALYLATPVGQTVPKHAKPTTAVGVKAVRDAIIGAAIPQGSASGFIGDRDTTPEPLLTASGL
jgi:subtilisin